MKHLEEAKLLDWSTDVQQCKEHVRKVQKALLALEQTLLRLQIDLGEEAAPTLLDDLPEPDAEVSTPE